MTQQQSQIVNQSPPPTPAQAAAAPDQHPRPEVPSQATRHLWVAAYLDRDFRRAALKHVYHQPEHAIAPSVGVDSASVLFHCKRARSLDVFQAIAVLVLFLFALLISGPAVFAVIGFLVFLHLGRVLIRTIGHAASWIKGGSASSLRLMIGGIMVLLVLGPLAFVLGGVLNAALWALLLSGGSGSSSSDLSTSEVGLGSVVAWALIFASVIGTFAGVKRSWIVRLKSEAVSPDAIKADPRLAYIKQAETGDVACYSGYYPFDYAGDVRRIWSLALTLRPVDGKSTGAEWPGFTASELTSHLLTGLNALGQDAGHTRHIPGLSVTKEAWISGLDAPGPLNWTGHIPGYSWAETCDDPNNVVRNYIKCQVRAWDGELIATVFVNVVLQGQSLYLEFSNLVLPPTRSEYHVFGNSRAMGPSAVALDVLGAIGHLPSQIGHGPAILVREIGNAIGTQRSKTDLRDAIPASTDYGARTSVRHLGTDSDVQHFFQERDAVRFGKILERQLMRLVQDFLSGKVDAAEFESKAATIINNSTVITGPVAAVGAGASGTIGAVGNRNQVAIDKGDNK